MAQWLAPWLRKWVTRVQFPVPLISFPCDLERLAQFCPRPLEGGTMF